jgi:hypothetical protein
LCRTENRAGDFHEGPPVVEVLGPGVAPGDELFPPAEPSAATPAHELTTRESPEAANDAPEQSTSDAAAASSASHGADVPALRHPAADRGTSSSRFEYTQRLPSPGEIAPLIVTAGKHASRRRSLLGEVLRVVIGGLMGAVLAQMILWWLPDPYRSDPLGVASRLPQQLHWMLPKQLQPTTDADSTNPNPADPEAAQTDTPLADVPELNSALPDVPIEPDGGGDTADPAGSSAASSDSNSPSPVSAPDSVADSNDAEDGPHSPSQAAERAQPDSTLGLRRGTLFTSLEVEGAVRDVQNATARMAAAKPLQLKTARGEWNQTLDQLAYRLTFADAGDAAVQDHVTPVESLVRAIWQQPSWRSAWVAHQAERWAGGLQVAAISDELIGLWVCGRVVEIVPDDGLYKTVVQSSARVHLIPVYSRIDPTQVDPPPYRVGDDVAIAGVLVSDPARDLIGYDGQQRPVVWGGLPVNVTPDP